MSEGSKVNNLMTEGSKLFMSKGSKLLDSMFKGMAKASELFDSVAKLGRQVFNSMAKLDDDFIADAINQPGPSHVTTST
ncbi:hypothetical protein PCANC_20331 [Puccinia coronata f. sp. avenae]|uniref:Uncharacterized protein n=1 Tax=Puccinia coronata f. sp. avenae TaxID=200324 RepID=A0A2N5TZL3_9BASI|nr:hypothetical protein PCANC_20331 [Puccinia coronata f. sp. avenae]